MKIIKDLSGFFCYNADKIIYAQLHVGDHGTPASISIQLPGETQTIYRTYDSGPRALIEAEKQYKRLIAFLAQDESTFFVFAEPRFTPGIDV